jgi:nucleoside-diphosphate-sugar epimerase
MRLLILGCTGFIGRRLAKLALAQGHFVAGISRGAAALNEAGIEQHVADRLPPDRIVEIVRTLRIDKVIDGAAYTLENSAPLIAALDGLIARYVLLSSGDVYFNYGLINRHDTGDPIKGWLAETSPLRTSRFPYRGGQPRAIDDPLRWMDDYDKIPIESCATNLKHTPWTILRLPMVYGPGDRLSRFAWIIAPSRAGLARLALPRSWARWQTTYGYVDDVASGILLAAAHDAAERRTFNLGEAEPASHMDWAQRFAAALNWNGSIEESDDPELPFARLIGRMDLTVPLLMSTTRIRDDLGFEETVSLEDAIDRTIAG